MVIQWLVLGWEVAQVEGDSGRLWPEVVAWVVKSGGGVTRYILIASSRETFMEFSRI